MQAPRLRQASAKTMSLHGAALRKKAVLLSYCGADQEAGVPISAALRRTFQNVFDDQDHKSITPGTP